MDTAKKRILITGATGNLGGAIAKAMCTHASHLCLGFKSSHRKAEELARSLAGGEARVNAFAQDLAADRGPENLIEHATHVMGGIDVLVNLASAFRKAPMAETSDEEWRETIDANLKAPFFLAKCAARAMESEGGSMIFFSDTAAARPYGNYLPYCMAKAGVETMVRGLARTFAPKISVNAIAPYLVSRPDDMSDKGWQDLINKTPSRRPTDPGEIAALVRWLALDAPTTTGQVITVDGGRLLR
jgi:NAD(P)-dependent dehydrogenase (short-subunit alcohol dehydrogenase family)